MFKAPSDSNKFLLLYNVSHGSHGIIIPLEGLRAIAAFMVFIVHYSAQITPWIDQSSLTWDLISYFRHIGSKGVELFFVISGFLIYGMVIKKDQPFPLYFARRIKRIYPTFLVMLFIYILLSFIFPQESKLPDGVIDSVVYIILNILLIPGIFPIEAIVTVSWSLSYEMFFYLCVPLMVFCFGLKKWSALNRVSLLVLLSLFGFILVSLGFQSHSQIMLFISGMLLFEFNNYYKASTSKISIHFSLISTVVALTIIKYFELPYVYSLLTLFVGFFCVCVSSFDSRTQLSKICSSPFLRCYGNMSYSYYLIHGITLKFFFLVFENYFPAHHQWDIILYILFIPVFIFTWLTSTALFLLVEKPFSLKKSNNKS